MSILRSPYEADQAASQLRSVASTMNTIVAELHQAAVWTGADAGRLVSDWQREVTDRLLRAATRVDLLSYEKVGE